MSRATGIKSPAVLARESLFRGQGGIGRTPATDYNSGPTTTTGGVLGVHNWSLEPVGLVRSQDNLAHVDGYPKGKAKDGKGEKTEGGLHESLSSNEVVKARSNASHNISSNRNEAKGHGEDLAEGVHSALHLGGLALGFGQIWQSNRAVNVIESQRQPFGLRESDQPAGHIRGHTLLVCLVKRDIALRHTNAGAQLGLANAQLVADQLYLVHAPIISATVCFVNSAAFCANTSRTNTLRP